MSAGTAGRPTRRRDLQRQYRRKPLRCQRTSVSGLKTTAASSERDLIRTRTAEGRSRATAQGKAMGRPPSLTPAQIKEATRRRAQGATLKELADSYDRSDIGQPAEYREHQPPGAAGAVGPRFGQGSKLRLGVHDPLDDGEQVKGAARQRGGPSPSTTTSFAATACRISATSGSQLPDQS